MKTAFPNVHERLDLAVQQELEDIKQHPSSPDLRVCGRNQSWIVAELMTQAGDHTSAGQAATEMAGDANARWQECYDAACIMARCVELAMCDERLSGRDRTKRARAYVGQAVKFLKSAIRKGFTEFDRLTNDTDLKPLRPHIAFVSLVTRIQAGHQRAENRNSA